MKLAAGYEQAKIRIINSLGQQIASDESNNLYRSINLKGLASGTYVVQVINKNRVTDNVKIVLAN